MVKFSVRDKLFRSLGSFFYDLHLFMPWQWLIDLCVWTSSIFQNRVPLVFLLLKEDNLGSLHPPVKMLFQRGLGDKLVEKYPDLLKKWNEIGDQTPTVPGPEELTKEFLSSV